MTAYGPRCQSTKTRVQMPNTKKTMPSTSTTQTLPQAPPPVASPLPPAPVPAATPQLPNAALLLYVQQTVAALDTVEVGLGADPALTPAQKRHALKFRKGGDKIIGQIGNLAHQQQLDSPGLNVADMVTTLGKAQALQPLSDRVAAFAKHIDDVIFKSEGDSLAMAQQFYALLQRRALTDGELATAMVPVVTYFARKPKAKVAGAPTRPQKKATAKAVKTLKKNAPQMLQAAPGATGPVASPGASPGAAPVAGGGGTAASGAAAPVTGGSGAAAPGNGAAGPATPTGAGHA